MSDTRTHGQGPAAAGLLRADHRDQVRQIAHQLMHRLPATIDVTDLIDAGLRGLAEALSERCRGVAATLDASSRMQVRRAMLRATGSIMLHQNSSWYPERETASAGRRAEQDFGALGSAGVTGKDESGFTLSNEG